MTKKQDYKLKIPIKAPKKNCDYCGKVLFYYHDEHGKLTDKIGYCLNKLCYDFFRV